MPHVNFRDCGWTEFVVRRRYDFAPGHPHGLVLILPDVPTPMTLPICSVVT